ncbi:MAG: Poly(glycerol-phosphate) alpha-glucosyltransferase [Ktedonobacterales bacterium]|jgi:glycosyltransferase involved in cell wall biosynthesis|nr:MAG: Poly(glycerol-phosphate) alpha-glucosyltransferase [Ktedonobacterales bacterium]
MRVVIVSKTFVADTAQRQLEWLARMPGIELTLITPPEWRSDDGRLLPFTPRFVKGYEVRQLPVWFNGHYHFYLYRGLRRAIRELRPEIVHIDEEPYNPAGMQAQRAADAVGARSVFVAWQNIARSYPAPFARMEQFNYQHTAHVIAGNAAAGEVVRAKGYAGPLSVFSVHGVDPEIYHPQPHTRHDDEFVIGYIGRLVLYKGVGLLIEALRDLPPRCTLHLLGSGPDEAGLRKMAAEQGVAERVRFLPAVPATEVPGALAGMDVLALPSLTQANWKEQFGRVLVEAMACEVAVVGSDSGEIPRVIGDAGLIVPEGDAQALGAALRRLADDAGLRRMYAGRGRERVLEQATQEQVARKIAGVYGEVMAAAAK